MITPRQTRLIRVADLHAFRRAIVAIASESPALVVVPTRAAARQIEGPPAATFVTRDELYDDLWSRLDPRPARATSFEREAIVHAAARQAAVRTPPPFQLRPGIVAEMLRFYDQLRRQGQPVARFEDILVESLERDVDLDRGAARMLDQTRFLAAVYRAYEARLAERSLVDEVGLRERLLETPARDPARHIVVTVGDWIADPHGLWRADFDLLSRLPGLERLDVIATGELLASGFDQRVHEWLPGIEDAGGDAAPGVVPKLLAPIGSTDAPLFVVRDREEELIAIAGRCRAEKLPLDRVAVVFRKPLPYLYMAGEIFGGASMAIRAFDALPLAADPFAAALDLVLELVASQFTRSAIVALLRSPHFWWERQGTAVTRDQIAALDRALIDARYFGGYERLESIAAELPPSHAAKSTLALVLTFTTPLRPLVSKRPASQQMDALLAFMTTNARTPESPRETRAQAAVFGILQSMATTHAAFDDRDAAIDDVAPDVRRWIEEATFAPETAGAGLRLMDAQAARYADVDRLFVIGLVEGDWPERPRPSIFYPPVLLAALGWPAERDRRGADRAAFVDLLRSPNGHVALSTFTLDDETLVEPSSLVDEIARAKLEVVEIDPVPPPLPAAPLGDRARAWAELRMSRTPGSDARFHGEAGPQAPREWSVSALETYLTCPFKFFARYVLGLEEEINEDEVMDPRQQGQFVHRVFEQFFATWQARGHRAITPENLAAARALFAEVVEERVAPLPDAEAALERTRLLGSPVAPGLGEIVFRMEAERPVEVVERLLEHRLHGEYTFGGPDGERRVRLKGVADRLDLLADGTIRLIDYKLSSVPQKSRALQLPIYGLCAEQRLQDHRGRRWTLGEAAYITMRGARRVVPLFTNRADRDEVLEAAQARLVAVIDGVERGAFPPTPQDVFLCGFCSYGSVCRKDYVGDV